MHRAIYSRDPIQSIESLSRALGVGGAELRSIALRAPKLYIGPKPKLKKNGGVREVFDTKPPLKPLLKKINNIFFRQVAFPEYLTGSLAGRDFIANVDIHKGSRRMISEDIAKFFDHITADRVYRIWREFFHFAENVADLLTCLTTKDGRVFQGTPTSSYLANLAFWDREPALAERMIGRGIRYSRYVDDITVSSMAEMSEEDKRWAIAQVYGMIGAAGFKPQRSKHKGLSARGPITLMGLNANASLRPTITKQERANTRALIFQLEGRLAAGETGLEFRVALNQATSKVGRLKRLHKQEASTLKGRIHTMRRAIDVLPVITKATIPFAQAVGKIDELPF